MLKRLIAEIKDCIFPVYCLGCSEEGKLVCTKCFKKIDPVGVFCCPRCRRRVVGGVCCDSCSRFSPLSAQISLLPYSENLLAGKIITDFKYNYLEELKLVFEDLIKIFVGKNSELLKNMDLIVPVPLHARRYAERGFNQAEIIARQLGHELKLPVALVLKRIVYTHQQAKLSREARIKNVAGAFELLENKLLAGKKIILVDDVFTTGSTMNECAKVLRLAGVREVVGFTLARGM